ncbi:MAG: acylphosphatase [Lachnospiraceae bacterium]|nr:acylphosphatase [Lachnospiraceae bacterium]
MAEERRRITFHGRVQGVGFRFQAQRYASAFGLKGWVKNEYDGSVIMEVQGSPVMINQMLKGLTSDRYITIEWVDSENLPLEEERGFHVRY